MDASVFMCYVLSENGMTLYKYLLVDEVFYNKVLVNAQVTHGFNRHILTMQLAPTIPNVSPKVPDPDPRIFVRPLPWPSKKQARTDRAERT